MRIVFMGTPEFALPTLAALIASKHEVVAVYSQPPRPKGRGQKLQPSKVQQLAEAHGIAAYHPTTLRTPEAQAEFAALGADVAVVAAYGLILPQAILDAPIYGCVNIHPSALPRWRGAAPIQRTIMAGDATTEICIMKMDAGLDTGDVYARSAQMIIADDASAGELHDTLAEQSAPLLLNTLDDIAAGDATATPQSQSGITYAEKITKEQCQIDWSQSADRIHNHIRGLAPYPGAWTMLGGEVLKVFKAGDRGLGIGDWGSNDRDGMQTGVTTNDQLTIRCGDGRAIQLLEVQKPGKPRMNADVFLRGHPVATGTKLG